MRSHSDKRRLKPLGHWMFWGRVQWALNHRRQPEIRRDSVRQARALIKDLRRAGEDCVLVGHGFRHACLMRELRRQGWRGSVVQRMRNGQILVFESPD